MSIAVVSCQCGSTDSLVRNFLKSVGYSGWLSVPIVKGKDKSLKVLEQLPRTDEREMLRSFLKEASKWAVIIGYDDYSMKWSDIAHNATKSKIEAEFVVKNFQFD